MALTTEQQAAIQEAIADMAEAAKRLLRGPDHYRATVILRATHLPNGDVVVTDDLQDRVLSVVTTRWPGGPALRVVTLDEARAAIEQLRRELSDHRDVNFRLGALFALDSLKTELIKL
jgi:hypothetical protein